LLQPKKKKKNKQEKNEKKTTKKTKKIKKTKKKFFFSNESSSFLPTYFVIQQKLILELFLCRYVFNRNVWSCV